MRICVHECYFQAEGEPGHPGDTGRMSCYTQCTCHNQSEEAFQQTQEYKAAATKTEAERIQKYGLRWSELLRLPYFDIVRNPMHTFC